MGGPTAGSPPSSLLSDASSPMIGSRCSKVEGDSTTAVRDCWRWRPPVPPPLPPPPLGRLSVGAEHVRRCLRSFGVSFDSEEDGMSARGTPLGCELSGQAARRGETELGSGLSPARSPERPRLDEAPEAWRRSLGGRSGAAASASRVLRSSERVGVSVRVGVRVRVGATEATGPTLAAAPRVVPLVGALAARQARVALRTVGA
eukprot:scaffold59486_cov38-Phaeocystis_antarctica.AAC.2